MTLSYGDQVPMTLGYDREYRTYFHLGTDYGTGGSDCYKPVKKTEDIPAISEDSGLPDRKKPAESDTEIGTVLTDTAESPTERPEKRQKFYHSGKKRHTPKTQPVVDAETPEISALNFSDGKRHDFRIFEESGLRIDEKIAVSADNGYPGIHKI